MTEAPGRSAAKATGAGGCGGKRGRITGFSAKSRGRLRRLLLMADGPDGWRPFAVTLTVPGPVLPAEDWRRLWDSYRKRLERQGVVAIWRVELQRRQQPHVHLLAWVDPSRPGRGRRVLHEGWTDVLHGSGPVTVEDESGNRTYANRLALPGAWDHAVHEDEPGERGNWWRYLCAHHSKSKQAQGGWQGRQWGVVGRSRMRRLPAETERLEGRAFTLAVRVLRRLTRARRATGARGTRVWYCGADTARRVAAWARAEGANGEGGER